jgi:2-polyprenyl-3-methyl-5-hydroxy-6-metoxy-1,4-benzoquinol methylase
MLARDWYYNDRRQVGLDFSAEAQVATYDRRQGETPDRAHKVLQSLGVKAGTVVADIGCGTGAVACEAAEMGAIVHAIDISPAMLAMAERRAADNGVALHEQSAGFLSFAFEPESFDVIISEFALHHLPDFWKAVALSRVMNALKPGGRFFLRDIVFTSKPDGVERSIEQWSDFLLKNHSFSRDEFAMHVRDEHSTFGWVIEGLLKEAGFADVSAEYRAPVYGTFRAHKPLTMHKKANGQ